MGGCVNCVQFQQNSFDKRSSLFVISLSTSPCSSLFVTFSTHFVTLSTSPCSGTGTGLPQSSGQKSLWAKIIIKNHHYRSSSSSFILCIWFCACKCLWSFQVCFQALGDAAFSFQFEGSEMVSIFKNSSEEPSKHLKGRIDCLVSVRVCVYLSHFSSQRANSFSPNPLRNYNILMITITITIPAGPADWRRHSGESSWSVHWALLECRKQVSVVIVVVVVAISLLLLLLLSACCCFCSCRQSSWWIHWA